MKKVIPVAGAVIENVNNEILCALRSPTMVIPNRWEFPGGKIEKGESIDQAIEREIMEELSCKIAFQSIYHECYHEYDEHIIHLITSKCTLISGKPVHREHSTILWLPRENLSSLHWAPPDIPTVEKLLHEK